MSSVLLMYNSDDTMAHLTAALAKKREQLGLGHSLEENSKTDKFTHMDRSISAPIMSRSRVIVISTMLFFAGSLGYGYVKYGHEPTSRVSSDRITISSVVTDLFQDFVPVTGTVVPENSVYMDALNGGQVTKVYVEVGDFVVAGQRLVELSNPTLQLEVIGREAQLAEQLNNLSVTKLSIEQRELTNKRDLIDINYRIEKLSRESERYRTLVGTGAITQVQFDDVETELNYQLALRDAVTESQRVNDLAQSTHINTLQSSVNMLNQNIGIVRENLKDLTLVAPIDGQVTSLEAENGETKSQGEPIIKIDQIDSFKISALIDEFYLSRVSIGQEADAEIDGQTHQFTVAKIYPEVHNRQFEVDLVSGTLPNTLRTGQSTRLRLTVGDSTQTLMIPNGAFYDDTGGLWVFVLNEDSNTASRREIQLGRRNSNNVEVVSGLLEGDRVITSSYSGFIEAEKLLLN
ncbi:MAG: hypothetical protein COA78_04100 [Blastopirellula sp.]|nr:MAG: hypothetical protein COA78_04100 [Blastopirellula sp.]